MALLQLTSASRQLGGIPNAPTWDPRPPQNSLPHLLLLLPPFPTQVLPVAQLLLSASAPFFYGKPQAPSSAPGAAARARPPRIPLGVGILMAAGVLQGVVLARFAVFDVVQLLVSARPTEGLLLGTLALTLAAGLAPLVFIFYKNNPVSLRVLSHGPVLQDVLSGNISSPKRALHASLPLRAHMGRGP